MTALSQANFKHVICERHRGSGQDADRSAQTLLFTEAAHFSSFRGILLLFVWRFVLCSYYWSPTYFKMLMRLLYCSMVDEYWVLVIRPLFVFSDTIWPSKYIPCFLLLLVHLLPTVLQATSTLIDRWGRQVRLPHACAHYHLDRQKDWFYDQFIVQLSYAPHIIKILDICCHALSS